MECRPVLQQTGNRVTMKTQSSTLDIVLAAMRMRKFQRAVIGLLIVLLVLAWVKRGPSQSPGVQSAITCKSKIAKLAIPREDERVKYISAMGNDAMNIENEYFTYVTMLTQSCFNQMHVGPEGDGGWEVCVDREYDITPPCLIYSFGVGDGEFGFEKSAEKKLGCEVHAFDPSMGLESHQFSEKGYFHNIGLDSKDTYAMNNRWKMRRLKTIMRDLGHSGRHIDLLKMDVEFSEWLALYDILQSDMLQYIRQIAMEVHTPEMDIHTKPDHYCTWSTRESLAFLLKILVQLRNAGMNLFYSSTNYRTMFTSDLTGIEERYCCHNLHMVNTKHEQNKFKGQ